MANKRIGDLPLLEAADIEGADRMLAWDASRNGGTGGTVSITVDALKAAAAGLLYATGSWTPVLAPGEHAYTMQAGRWSRVGTSMTVWFDVVLTMVDPAAAGHVSITGLPAISRAGFTYYGTIAAGLRGSPGGALRLTALIEPGTASITVLGPGILGPLSIAEQVEAGSRLRGTITYEAAA